MKTLTILIFSLSLIAITLWAQTAATIDVTVTITGTPQQKAAIFRKFALARGWPEEIQVDGIATPNPETSKAFTERFLEAHILQAVQDADVEDAVKTARRTAKDAADASTKGSKIPVPTPTPKAKPATAKIVAPVAKKPE